jgi:prepilin-type N-terminal cleavage/methylation domain-containing protein
MPAVDPIPMLHRSPVTQRPGTPPAPNTQAGFTLAEIATVLVLIGLLASLFVLGNGILVQSRIRSMANQFEELRTAVLTYQDRYGALPGDDPRADGRWVDGVGASRAKNGTGDGRISGSYQDPPPPGDPLVALVVNALQGESLNFWWHLRLAQLIISPPPVISLVAPPLNFFSGVTGVEWGALGFPRLAVCTANLPGDVALGIDNRLDDGDPRRGLIRAAKQSVENQPLAAADATITSYVSGDADFYILCRRLD